MTKPSRAIEAARSPKPKIPSWWLCGKCGHRSYIEVYNGRTPTAENEVKATHCPHCGDDGFMEVSDP